MSKKLNLASKVKSLSAGTSFNVSSERERQTVCRIAKVLKDSGAIEFDIVTKREGNQFKVAAI